jgi:hypothetical protein
LTRLHIRYTASSLTDDLFLTHTKDRRNWQARYVIQHPVASSAAQCSAKMAATDCELMCKARVPAAQKLLSNNLMPVGVSGADNKSEASLLTACVSSCALAKQATIDKTTWYFEADLATRIMREKQTLARLTGWSMAEINDLPSARTYSDPKEANNTEPVQVASTAEPSEKPPRPPWWIRAIEKVKALGQSLIP